MKKYSAKSVFHTAVLTTTLLVVPFFASAYQASPVANTKNATFITEKSAIMNGAVNANETPDTFAWFEWGISGRSTVYETTHRQIGAGNTLADFNDTAYGLAPGVQYFYRQVAESSRGRDVGMTTYFTTKNLVTAVDPAVIIQTYTPTNILEKSAMLRGYIAPHEGQGVRWWFEWGTTNKFENTTPANGWGTDSGIAQTNITNLTPGTQYFYRVVAENTQGVVYGNAYSFTTLGIPPPPPETPRAQNIPQAQSNDGVSRVVTTNAVTANTPASGQAGNGVMAFNWGGTSVNTGNNLPGSALVVPGNIFGSLFGGNKKTTNTATVASSDNKKDTTNTNTQSAVAPASTPIGTFWNTLTGKKVAMVNIEKIGPTSAPAHTPVEYRVTYTYSRASVSTNAKLKIILPGSVVYIGDNTTNELLLEDGSGPERTYVLPVGRLENGSTRTISILGMTTADANGIFPDARARLEFTASTGGVEVVSAEGASATSAVGASVGSSTSILPSTFFGWLLYVILITLIIFLVRKARAYYTNRKEAIALEEEAMRKERIARQIGNGTVPA